MRKFPKQFSRYGNQYTRQALLKKPCVQVAIYSSEMSAAQPYTDYVVYPDSIHERPEVARTIHQALNIAHEVMPNAK